MSEVAPVLVFTWGNPSRGDDALGCAFFDQMEADKPAIVDILTDFQLQIEHCTDIENRDMVIFVDASTGIREGYEMNRIQPENDRSYTTHAMSPQALLSVCEQVNKSPLPESWLLEIKGYEFGLGQAMTAQAEKNLSEAFQYLDNFIRIKNTKIKKTCISNY